MDQVLKFKFLHLVKPIFHSLHITKYFPLILITVTSFKGVSCTNDLRRYSGHNYNLEIQQQLGSGSHQNMYSFYTDPTHISKSIMTTTGALNSGPFSGDAAFFDTYRKPILQNIIDRQEETGHEGSHSSQLPVENASHENQEPTKVHETELNEHEHEGGGESHSHSSELTPFEETFENLTTPEKLLPIINNLTLIALVVLHMPAIVPTILIPLAFFCVGALMIPITRVNYFINHKDDGEDGRRRSLDLVSSFITSLW